MERGHPGSLAHGWHGAHSESAAASSLPAPPVVALWELTLSLLHQPLCYRIIHHYSGSTSRAMGGEAVGGGGGGGVLL